MKPNCKSRDKACLVSTAIIKTRSINLTVCEAPVRVLKILIKNKPPRNNPCVVGAL